MVRKIFPAAFFAEFLQFLKPELPWRDAGGSGGRVKARSHEKRGAGMDPPKGRTA